MKANLHNKRLPFLGRVTVHSPVEIFFLDLMLTEQKFRSIIELGGGNCGITLLFGVHALRMGAHVDSFDRKPEPQDKVYRMLRTVLPFQHHQADVFAPETQTKIGKIIQREGRSLVYCDDGKKVDEFNMYAPMLKPNDMIMAHDRPVEIKIGDIEDAVEKYGLQKSYEPEITGLRASLFCFTKNASSG